MAIKVTKSQENKRIDALQGKGSGGGVSFDPIISPTAPTITHNGDIWIKIDNTTDKNASAWYKAISNTWVLQFRFGGGGITIPNAILLNAEDVT